LMVVEWKGKERRRERKREQTWEAAVSAAALTQHSH
jgi:hypothetical protein